MGLEASDSVVDVVVADRAPSPDGTSNGGSVVDLVLRGASGAAGSRLLWVSPTTGAAEHWRTDDGTLEVVRVAVPATQYTASYLGVGAAQIWPTLHGIDCPLPESSWNAYVGVNQALADEAALVAPQDARVTVHDYSVLHVVPALRRLRPDLRIGYVHHTPWPAVADVADELRRRLLRKLFRAASAADVVCVSAQRWAFHLDGWGRVRSAVVPPGVDADLLRSQAAAATHGRWARCLRDDRYERPVLAVVGRADPAKNADVVIRAWCELVRRGERGTLCLHEVPTSRSSLPFYGAYAKSVAHAVATGNWTRPGSVVAYESSDRGDALHLLREADVVVVCSRADGWNLVAAEAAVLGPPEQQLVVSAGIGAAELLRPRAWVVDDAGSDASVADGLREALAAWAARHPRGDVALPSPREWWRGVSTAVDAASRSAGLPA